MRFGPSFVPGPRDLANIRRLPPMGDASESGTLDVDRLLGGTRDPAHVFPPIVYVPCAPAQSDEELTIDLRVTKDGRLALLVYSAMDRLIAHCGPAQPWTVMATKDLEQARLATGFELILLDLDIPEELRRTGGEI
jgi:hypothetical protein